jgi:hypothetical protein
MSPPPQHPNAALAEPEAASPAVSQASQHNASDRGTQLKALVQALARQAARDAFGVGTGDLTPVESP